MRTTAIHFRSGEGAAVYESKRIFKVQSVFTGTDDIHCVFALAAAGCVQVFAKAHMLSQEAGRLDMAVSVAQSLAEECSGSRMEDNQRYYDELGNVCGKEDGVYLAEILQTEQAGMNQIHITVMDMKTQDTLYTLQTASYLPNGTGGGNE